MWSLQASAISFSSGSCPQGLYHHDWYVICLGLPVPTPIQEMSRQCGSCLFSPSDSMMNSTSLQECDKKSFTTKMGHLMVDQLLDFLPSPKALTYWHLYFGLFHEEFESPCSSLWQLKLPFLLPIYCLFGSLLPFWPAPLYLPLVKSLCRPPGLSI